MQVLANPNRFLKIQAAVQPYLWVVTLGLFGCGLYLALFASPADYQQGETVRIMYVHVPAASLAMGIYMVIAIASAVAIIFRHPLADVAAKTAAPIGAVYTFLSLVTGSLWGKPMWGTWWAWDARMTSVFFLFLLYLGYMAIWQAIDDPHRAAPIARIVALVGSVIVPVIKFSVNWWHTLHQPASLIRLDGPSIAGSFLWPLLIMMAAYGMLFLSLHLVSMRSEIYARRIRQIHLQQARRH